MKSCLLFLLFSATLGLLPVVSSFAANIGEVAPPLKIAEWISGTPVNLSDSKGSNVCVVIFWEPWCHICAESLPQLAELERKFKNRAVSMVAISQEPPGTIREFTQRMGDQFVFTLGADDAHQTVDAYIPNLRERSVPYAFIVGTNGVILWRRSPLAGLDIALEKILESRFDIEAEKRAVQAEKLYAEYFDLVANEAGRTNAAAIGEQIAHDGISNPWLLNRLAWNILIHPLVKNRDLDLALRAGKSACEATGNSNAAFLDTYARALLENGRLNDAIRTQKQAVEVCADARLRTELEERSREYEARVKK